MRDAIPEYSRRPEDLSIIDGNSHTDISITMSRKEEPEERFRRHCEDNYGLRDY
ncbi:hypothetical protein [Methanogenium organophilum]|uniref:Uncharacterized protein n=1 Tax=Methanogenium organophilum TaxID=2199 RepID=A0A9X9S6B1_METOG|nr:hypothetical protein [Methanogenium organophilum]WAI02218.1 hypothetical protein OU421_04930 [Methanogenium organophilum]